MDTDFLTQTSGRVGSQPELHDPFSDPCESVFIRGSIQFFGLRKSSLWRRNWWTLRRMRIDLADDWWLFFTGESLDQTGTTGSLPCPGVIADGLGGEDVSRRASAGGCRRTRKTL